jgi:hypothetical protein
MKGSTRQYRPRLVCVVLAVFGCLLGLVVVVESLSGAKEPGAPQFQLVVLILTASVPGLVKYAWRRPLWGGVELMVIGSLTIIASVVFIVVYSSAEFRSTGAGLWVIVSGVFVFLGGMVGALDSRPRRAHKS